MIELMRNPRKRRPGREQKLTADIVKQIIRDRPPMRMGRMKFYDKWAAKVGVKTCAITKALTEIDNGRKS